MDGAVVRILTALGDELRSAAEVSLLSGVPEETVAHRLAELLHTGQVELFSHVEDGRAVQLYRLTARARLTRLGPGGTAG